MQLRPDVADPKPGRPVLLQPNKVMRLGHIINCLIFVWPYVLNSMTALVYLNV